jgi:hypothetical protein
MRPFIAAMSVVPILTMCAYSARSQTQVPSGGPAPRAEAGRPRVEIDRMSVYVCPRHPEARATWPAQCPMCHARMERQSSLQARRRMGRANTTESAGPAISPQIRMQYRMMMNAAVHPYDPDVLLGSSRMLGLSSQQVRDLRAIAMRARRAAMGVLTDAQRRQLMPLDHMMDAPPSMARMHQRMMGERRDPPAYGYDPGSARTRLMDEDQEFGEGGFDEGEQGFGSDEGFGNDEGFGFGDEFGDEGFGGEGFGDEGFGNEGFGRDEGFGNNDEFRGEQGFGFGDNGGLREERGLRPGEGFGNSNDGLRGERGFGDAQRFGGNESRGNAEDSRRNRSPGTWQTVPPR